MSETRTRDGEERRLAEIIITYSSRRDRKKKDLMILYQIGQATEENKFSIRKEIQKYGNDPMESGQ